MTTGDHAEALNEELRSYLGHDELQLAVEGAGYGVTRNGQTAKNLSEGERTAVALAVLPAVA